MLNRLQERNLRRIIKRGGCLQLPALGGRTLQVEVNRHRTGVALHVEIQGYPGQQPKACYGPAREVYPLAAELLDALVAHRTAEVAHG